MKREIKFRAWDNLRKEMFLPASINLFIGTPRYCGDDPQDTLLMQYTGLKDKNGKEIYEGDIRREEIEEDEGDRRMYFVCKWLKQTCSFVWMDFGDTVTDWNKEKDMEYPCSLLKEEAQLYVICGNIYENPELLTN